MIAKDYSPEGLRGLAAVTVECETTASVGRCVLENTLDR